jgi:aspartate--ammonia ligase
MAKADILEVEKNIQFVKEFFTKQLSDKLNLTKISSPFIVLEDTGLNDDLNGIERPVSFPVKSLNNQKAVVVHSLAKWKRLRIKQLDIELNKGILTDMRALRPDEDFTPIHSIYVDQWDWEMRVDSRQRNIPFLKEIVSIIYKAIRDTEREVSKLTNDKPGLPENIHFIHSEELLQLYPTLSPKERENEITKQYGAVFIMGIGGKLSNGAIHDGRAPDYDDWSTPNKDGFFGLNGDIMLWNSILNTAFEISSMGVRVDKNALLNQLEERNCMERATLPFHKKLLEGGMYESIGGGIGQSRMCMFMLRKKHIGEVQVSVWNEEERERLKAEGIYLL